MDSPNHLDLSMDPMQLSLNDSYDGFNSGSVSRHDSLVGIPNYAHQDSDRPVGRGYQNAMVKDSPHGLSGWTTMPQSPEQYKYPVALDRAPLGWNVPTPPISDAGNASLPAIHANAHSSSLGGMYLANNVFKSEPQMSLMSSIGPLDAAAMVPQYGSLGLDEVSFGSYTYDPSQRAASQSMSSQLEYGTPQSVSQAPLPIFQQPSVPQSVMPPTPFRFPNIHDNTASSLEAMHTPSPCSSYSHSYDRTLLGDFQQSNNSRPIQIQMANATPNNAAQTENGLNLTPRSYSYDPSHGHVAKRTVAMCWEHGCNGRKFSTSSNLLRHRREKDGSASKSVCPDCGAQFTRTTARNGHLAHGKCTKSRRQSTDDS